MPSARKLIEAGLDLEKAGSLPKALECYEKAAATGGDPVTQAEAVRRQSHVHRNRGDWPKALEAARRSAEIALDLLGVAMLNRAEAAAGLGDHDGAEQFASAALGYFSITENAWRRAYCLRRLGDMARQQGNPTAAHRFYQAGLGFAESINLDSESRTLRDRLAELQAVAGEDRSAAEPEAGGPRRRRR